MRIIAFSGYKGSGKSFVSKILKKYLKLHGLKVKEDSYAEPMKRFCVDVLGIDEDLIYGDDSKKNLKTKYKWSRLPKYIKDRFPNHGKYLTGREVQCVFGTELTRELFTQDIWIDCLNRKILKAKAKGIQYFIITDLRFKNELKSIKELGGEVWFIYGNRVVKKDKKTAAHITEKNYNYICKRSNYLIKNDLIDNKKSIELKIAEILKTNGAL